MPFIRVVARLALPLLLFRFTGAVTLAAQTELPSLSEPAISPDGGERLPLRPEGTSGRCQLPAVKRTLLITNAATESRPMYSPDGAKLAFVSTRTGGGNVYVLTLANGHLDRMTYSDSLDQMDGWSSDGRWLYFTSSVNDIAGQGDICSGERGGRDAARGEPGAVPGGV